ncbi:pre-mRNA splicing factor [Chloropicon primus]|uniref:Pre-mRNA splicing factor n=2 Tax=Chloropicon primus TaxID=1764295 RepID=A0A5B8MR16_9CHLO|nr:pre-mRNA splicing factor [Chloropicon primus]|eukprot:QDZ22821.1 pre-mRNA splicing factor [Chloropicon primus]
MLERRRKQREENMKKELEQYRKENPKISEQFSDLKRALGSMSEQDWDQIPEIGDRSVKRTPRGKQSFVPVPDTLLARAAQEKQSVSTIDAGIDPRGGAETSTSAGVSTTTDLTAVGEGRGTVLSMKLDRLGDKVASQSGLSTSVDPKGYLTSLQSQLPLGAGTFQQTDIQDVKKARKLLQSVTQTNPTHAPGWIAAARLESDLGKGQKARSLIAKGCAACPKSEDIWLHASLLQQTQEEKKICVARGLAQIPKSVKLWLEAARLEETAPGTETGGGDSNQAQRRVLRKALERLPNSVRLWRALVDLSTEEDARILLRRAVECCPQHKELWLALAKLETYDKAKKVLNKARQTLPTEPLIWITAAKLEETKNREKKKQDDVEMKDQEAELDPKTSFGVFEECGLVGKIVDRAIKSLKQHGAVVSREKWLSFAEDCERAVPSPALHVCAQIVKQTIGIGVEEEDAKATWVADAEDCKGLWRRAAMLEKHHGDPGMLDSILKRAVTYCPQSEMLWLMGAKERWLKGDVPGARMVLQEAFTANPDSEQIVLAAFKLEFENNETERAKMLLQRARQQGGGERVWMKSALLERDLGNAQEEIDILTEGLEVHGKSEDSWKMHLMLAQARVRRGETDLARQAYEKGVRSVPMCYQLRQSHASLEERLGSIGRARAILEQARFKIPGCPELWLAAIRTERRAGNAKQAEAIMAKALQECPDSGILWNEVITTAPRPQRKAKSVDALKRCSNDPHVVSAVAQLFMVDHKTEKARSWFNRSVTLDPDAGDLWAHYYRFECYYGGNTNSGGVGTGEREREVERRCVEADPKHGERWQRISKTLPKDQASTQNVLAKTALDIETNPIPLP